MTRAARNHHPAKTIKPPVKRDGSGAGVSIPGGRNQEIVDIDGRKVTLTNLRKLFWPDLGITKGDLIRYYLEISPVLLPHLVDSAMVMKRYPEGAAGEFFFQKRAPEPRPEWIEVCLIEHASGNIIDFPVVRDLPTLLWIINLGCIDLNPWYARCDDVDRPDYLHFDLDPVEPADFGKILKAAGIVHSALDALGMPNFAKTTGSRGLHVYVPTIRGPTQKQVRTFAKKKLLEVFHASFAKDVPSLRLSATTRDAAEAREWFWRAGTDLDGIVAMAMPAEIL